MQLAKKTSRNLIKWPTPRFVIFISKQSSISLLPTYILPIELGSETPYDMAVNLGRKEIANIILEKVREGKGNKMCDYACPPLKTGITTMNSCYQPDLLQGTTKYIYNG